MTCHNCIDGWKVVNTPKGEAVTPCECRATRIASQCRGLPESKEAAVLISDALSTLETLAYFPTGKGARAAIGRAIAEMCNTLDDVRFLMVQACELHTKWEDCGIPGLRLIMHDREEERYMNRTSQTKALSAASPASQDAPMALGVSEAAAKTKMRPSPRQGSFARLLEHTVTAPQDRKEFGDIGKKKA